MPTPEKINISNIKSKFCAKFKVIYTGTGKVINYKMI